MALKVRIGGVPEHFNLPWYQALAQGALTNDTYDVLWKDCPEGTGSMNAQINSGELDMAVMLTEGAILNIVETSQAKIVGHYVNTPLQWGIFRPAGDIRPLEETANKTIAVSRIGSGSHLMSYVLAEQNHWNKDTLSFLPCGKIEQIVCSLEDKKADVFLWERYMTQPYVEAGRVQQIGICMAPWPSFSIVANSTFLDQNKEIIRSIIETIHKVNYAIAQHPDIAMDISTYFQLRFEQIKEWIHQTEWSTHVGINIKGLQAAQDMLLTSGRIQQRAPISTLYQEL